MPMITKVFYPSGVYVVCMSSLKAAILSGAKVICIGSGLDLEASREYARYLTTKEG